MKPIDGPECHFIISAWISAFDIFDKSEGQRSKSPEGVDFLPQPTSTSTHGLNQPQPTVLTKPNHYKPTTNLNPRHNQPQHHRDPSSNPATHCHQTYRDPLRPPRPIKQTSTCSWTHHHWTLDR